MNCNHELKDLTYFYTAKVFEAFSQVQKNSFVLNEKGKEMKLKYCTKCGQVFVKEAE